MRIDVATVCAGCGTPTKQAVKGRCPKCAPAHERRRSELRRKSTQPWSRLYNLARWRRCRAAALERDGRRCRLALPGCLGSERLRGHHRPRSVAQLWAIARGEWSAFVELACDVDAVVTACEPCHHADDARMRKGGPAHARATPPTSAPGRQIPWPDHEPVFSGRE